MTTYRASNYKSHPGRARRQTQKFSRRQSPLHTDAAYLVAEGVSHALVREIDPLVVQPAARKPLRPPKIGCSVLFVRSPNSVGMVLLYGKREQRHLLTESGWTYRGVN